MKRRAQAGGFTIIESMIVLAVTGAMFVIAVTAFYGQQEKTRFSQGNRDADSRITDVANDVISGYFPETSDWRCSAVPNQPPEIRAADAAQGTNEDCIFLGKAIHFGPGEVNCSNNCASARSVTIVGNRIALGGADVTSLDEAKPTAAPDNSPYVSPFTFGYGLGVGRVFDQAGNSLSGIAFLTSLSSYATNGDPVAGSQTAALYGVRGPVGQTVANFDTDIEALLETNRITSATICFRNGTGSNARQAALEITEQAAGINTRLIIDSVPVGCTS